MRTRPGLLAAAVAMAVAAGGCGGGTHATSPPRTATSPASSAATSAPEVPNPFTIVARYSAASLGLRRLKACHKGGGGGCTEELPIGPDGNLYVADSVTATVTVVSPASKVLRRWGRPGKGPGEFSFVTKDPQDPTDIVASIAVGPEGKVHVSCSGNGRVEVFSPDGAFIRQFGSFGAARGQFLGGSSDLAVGPDGSAYVADEQVNTVSKFSPASSPGRSETLRPPIRSSAESSTYRASTPTAGWSRPATPRGAILYIGGNGHKVDSFHTTGDFPAADVGPCNVTVDGMGDTLVTSCGGPYNQACCPTHPYQFELVFDRAHRLVGAWFDSPFVVSPRFGSHCEIFTLDDDGSILKLKVALPGA